MTIRIDVDGDEELIAKLNALGRRAGPAMDRIVQATAIELRSDIVRRIQRGPKTGAIYMRGAISHQVSAPGQAPATDTGRLVGSIYFDTGNGMFGASSAVVGSRLAYAAYLEYGTRNMRPRPVWQKAADRAQVKFVERIRKYLERVADE